MRVIQPSTRSTLGEYDSRSPLARYVWYVTWYLRSSCCSETHVHPRSVRSFYRLSTLDVTHVRKCTRLSLLYRTASDEKLGMGLGTRLASQHGACDYEQLTPMQIVDNTELWGGSLLGVLIFQRLGFNDGSLFVSQALRSVDSSKKQSMLVMKGGGAS